MAASKLHVAFVHPNLGIDGAERLVVDVAVGLQKLGHSVDIYTSYHNPKHCFDETRDGTLRLHVKRSLLPRSIFGWFHVLFAHLAQLQLVLQLIMSGDAAKYDVFFVDQLATCVPILRVTGKRVVFYCHFPDKLLAAGAYIDNEGAATRNQRVGLMKRLYRIPMAWLEEVTTRQADAILANSNFTARVFRTHFPNIKRTPRVVYPGIDGAAYAPLSAKDEAAIDVRRVLSDRPTLLSINRIEGKKNLVLAIHTFSRVRAEFPGLRLVVAGGYDPRLLDNRTTLAALQELCKTLSLRSTISSSDNNEDDATTDVLFVLNFSGTQRRALLNAPSTRVLLYTPTNEHFGIGPVEGMRAGLPVLACASGGPLESIRDSDTGRLRPPKPDAWARALTELLRFSPAERAALAKRARKRAEGMFGLDAMAHGVEDALKEAVALGPLPVRNSHELVFVVLILTLIFAGTIAAVVYDKLYLIPAV